MFDNVVKNVPATETFISNPIFYLQEKNGYSQLESMKTDLEEYCKTQKRLRELFELDKPVKRTLLRK